MLAQAAESFNQIIAKAFGEPADAKEFATLAQWVNYDGYRAIFEARSEHRRGMILWMSHPAWPSMVWQTYDYYFEPTGAYFGSKKACEPIHIQWNPIREDIEVVNYHAFDHSGVRMLMAQQTLSMAQWDNQNRTDKFVGGRIDCMKAGAYIEKAPLGYYKEGKSRETYCRLDANGRLISQAFKWKLEGDTNKAILEKLAARGLSLTKQKLHKILVNPFYAGKIRHKFTNMELIDGQIEPAVTYIDFLKVQDILSGRTGTYVHKKEKPTFPLTHHVLCGDDGKPFTSYTKTKKLKTREIVFGYYKCNQQGCHTNVSAKEMHDKYVELLFMYDLDEEVLSAFSIIVRRMMQDYSDVSEKEASALKRKISEINRTVKEIKLRFASGKIDEDTYSVAIQEYSNRKDVLLLELEKWQINLSNQNDSCDNRNCLKDRDFVEKLKPGNQEKNPKIGLSRRCVLG